MYQILYFHEKLTKKSRFRVHGTRKCKSFNWNIVNHQKNLHNILIFTLPRQIKHLNNPQEQISTRAQKRQWSIKSSFQKQPRETQKPIDLKAKRIQNQLFKFLICSIQSFKDKTLTLKTSPKNIKKLNIIYFRKKILLFYISLDLDAQTGIQLWYTHQ